MLNASSLLLGEEAGVTWGLGSTMADSPGVSDSPGTVLLEMSHLLSKKAKALSKRTYVSSEEEVDGM